MRRYDLTGEPLARADAQNAFLRALVQLCPKALDELEQIPERTSSPSAVSRTIWTDPNYEVWAMRWGVIDAASPISQPAPPAWFVLWGRVIHEFAATYGKRVRDVSNRFQIGASLLPSFEDDRRKHLAKHCPGCSARQAEVAAQWRINRTDPWVADLVAPECARMIAAQRSRQLRMFAPGLTLLEYILLTDKEKLKRINEQAEKTFGQIVGERDVIQARPKLNLHAEWLVRRVCWNWSTARIAKHCGNKQSAVSKSVAQLAELAQLRLPLSRAKAGEAKSTLHFFGALEK